ncbi:hypothetical protein ebA749 [Aromatoleum aromaticum EbN1]|uniref:Uncharacterized protein n=1 Tax=Aromatoleum aromaticum (strain DSM 19018 / LMG 30748 / EbN1) TaxID=76114 RepID=Q5P857_AROAE|nr:hypothetical protein ebA749 [Aromatoleum aromaticum EbN1]
MGGMPQSWLSQSRPHDEPQRRRLTPSSFRLHCGRCG